MLRSKISLQLRRWARFTRREALTIARLKNTTLPRPIGYKVQFLYLLCAQGCPVASTARCSYLRYIVGAAPDVPERQR
jgi:hypothetical protein